MLPVMCHIVLHYTDSVCIIIYNAYTIITGFRYSCWTIQCHIVDSSTCRKYRRNILYWQRSIVWHLFPHTEAVIANLWRFKSSCFCKSNFQLMNFFFFLSLFPYFVFGFLTLVLDNYKWNARAMNSTN